MSITRSFLFFLLFVSGNLLKGQQRYELNQYNGLPLNAQINDIKLGEGISSYVATNEGLYYVPSVNVESREIIPNRYVQALSDPEKSSFYIGGNEVFSISSNPGAQFNIGDKSTNITCICKTKGDIWFGTNDGIYVVNDRNNKVIRHYVPNNSSLVSKQINFIHSDKYGIIWVGSKNGLLRVDDDNWKIYEKNHSFEGIYENSEGLWVLSDNELWNIDNIDRANRWYKLNLKKDLKKGNVNDLVVDSRGRLIIASDILVRFDPYNNDIERYGNDLGLVSQKCTSLAIDSEDRVWIGTGDSGLYTVGFKDHLQARKDKTPLEIVLISQQPTCFNENDGSIKLLVKGGSKNITIEWSTGESDERSLENLIAGDYSVTVIDPKKDTISKHISLIQPDELKIKTKEITKNLTDNNSTVVFDISGGTPGYRLEIDRVYTDNPAKNVIPGTHEVKVTDVFGCTAFVDFEIEGEVSFSHFDVNTVKVGQVIQIENLYFAADSVEITNASKPTLDEIFNFLNENNNIVVEIGGHTNNIPPDAYCDNLSTLRAKNIAEYLINRGIESSRVDFKGYGKRFPIATNDTADGRKKNQRVELKILSIGN